jgi:hypothetical protein
MAKKRFKYADFCQSCRKQMSQDDQIVYVEDGANRYFCSEKCIRTYYDPMADYYKTQHFKLRDAHDIPEADFKKYESYAPLCLNNPDEVWVDENENGETFYFFIGNYTDEGGRFSYVVMCFCLELEPTYILLSFPTRDKKLLENYRVGKKFDINEIEQEAAVSAGESEVAPQLDPFIQSRAIEEEMLRHRGKEDIPANEFDDYAHLLEETIESPEEIWELTDDKHNMILTLISKPNDEVNYVVICSYDENAEGRDAWKVLYHFPTNDPQLVQRYRRGHLREGSTSSFIQ